MPDTAAELQASPRPLLSAQTATRSTPPEVAAAGLQRAWAVLTFYDLQMLGGEVP